MLSLTNNAMAKLAVSLFLLLAGHAFAGYHEAEQHKLSERGYYPTDLTSVYPTQNISIPIDHFHNETRYAPHSNATFENSYWMDTSYYQPGGPVIVHAIGEDGTSDLVFLQKGLLNDLANATGGVAVVWGQRYYAGNYNIVPNYTTENLRFHSTEQALADLAYFSTHASFSGLEHMNLTAPGTPWIIIGGSYAGVISAFTRIQYPDLFMGGLASSGVSVAMLDFWQYYDVVRRYGPSSCIEAQQKLTAISDKILLSGNQTQITQLKKAFGIQDPAGATNSVFASILSAPMGGWQGRFWVPSANYPFTGPGTFCANVTSQEILFASTSSLKDTAREMIVNGGYANETNTLLNPVLNWIGSIATYYLGFCGNGSTIDECFSFGQPAPYNWLSCTENGLLGLAYTPGQPGRPNALPVGSRLLTVEVGLKNCMDTYNITCGPDLNTYNKYGGFNMSYPRLALTTGQLDIWRGATPLAEEIEFGVPNPRLTNKGTLSSLEVVIESGGHEWDLYDVFPNQTTASFPPEVIKSVHQVEIQAVKSWLAEWQNEQDSK